MMYKTPMMIPAAPKVGGTCKRYAPELGDDDGDDDDDDDARMVTWFLEVGIMTAYPSRGLQESYIPDEDGDGVTVS